jgi:hypothetical protein
MNYNLKNYTNLGYIHIPRYEQGRATQRGLAAAMTKNGKWVVVQCHVDNSTRTVTVEKRYSIGYLPSASRASTLAASYVSESSFL